MEPVLRPSTEEGSQPFYYESDKAGTTRQDIEVTNVARVSRITRTGRIYVPPKLEKVPNKDKGKRKVNFQVNEEVEADLDEPQHNPEEITEEEACEFLRFIKQSEYKVVDQLNRTPARISMLSLLMSSEAHRNVLMKVLNQAHVSCDISTDKLGGIINNIVAFYPEEFSSFKGRPKKTPEKNNKKVREREENNTQNGIKASALSLPSVSQSKGRRV
ncbi:hypothetical protein Lal_00001156 [Lupinus albus]|nr:hypothetical protein Lal_00001156 [Lupinus albus]